MKFNQIKTPALIVDLEAMESNLRGMANFFADRPCKLRPHFKNHKAPLLARKQVRAGAIGMTCATTREAEILVEHGITSILIANEIAGQEKAEHVADLSRRASVMVCVDNCHSIRDLAVAHRNRRVPAEVLIDIDIGLNRCGVAPGQAVLDLARYALDQSLTVRGIMGYDGHLQAMPPSPERDEAVRHGSKSIVESATLLEGIGIPAPIRSTGGTGTYAVSGGYSGITEIQAGSYLLMDDIYANRGAPFRRSLTVLATVISTRGREHAVLDCGVKAISGERGLPALKDLPGAHLTALHAEHAIIKTDPNYPPLTPGQKVEVWVHYGDATVNLHSRMYGVCHGEVTEIIPIER
ncbi:MAG TPA: alanine racemase [Alloacidobacterium sp.]|jgi:D-serine deaminase-like pyridoxal phosphate-dependent protein|nr:alanine racemase [Alloacidobacterium sp.]